MASQDPAIHHDRLEYTVAVARQSADAGMRAAVRMRAVLAVAMAAAFALVVTSATANAATYTVNTLDDSSGNSDCSLRDAINAANGTPTSGSTCTTKGSGKDTINFSMSGTIRFFRLRPLCFRIAAARKIQLPKGGSRVTSPAPSAAHLPQT
jgi:CSLREA domain-containing protein